MQGAKGKVYQIVVHAFAAVGITFVAMFFAIRFHWTNVSGIVDAKSMEFERANDASRQVLGVSDLKSSAQEEDLKLDAEIARLSALQKAQRYNACSILALKDMAPRDVASIRDMQSIDNSEIIVSKMVFVLKDTLGNPQEAEKNVESCLASQKSPDGNDSSLSPVEDVSSMKSAFAWSRDEEWESIAQAVVKDADAIDRAAAAADIEPRLIVSSLIVEQIRLFHSQRELFKKFFEPLKILGNSTVISLGVMGIKPPTAESIERNLKDVSSPFYLGEKYDHRLDYPEGVDIEKERFARLTDENNHYWSYLYGALYLKQIMHQWNVAGYDITYRPEIVGTLFNVGFPQSHPNAHPQVGGSVIRVDSEHEYSFGRLAYEFYYSGQLLKEFPYKIQ